MDCLRCHGLMVQESFDEVRGDPYEVRFRGWRCVCCGNIDDPVIRRNRTCVPLTSLSDTLPGVLVSQLQEEWNLEVA